VTLYGTRLPRGASVLVDGVPARVVFDGAPQWVIVLMPRHVPGRVDITVFAPDGAGETLPGAYTYLPSPGGPVAPPAPQPTVPQPAPTTAPTTAPTGAPTQPGGPVVRTEFGPGITLVPVRPGSMLAGASALDWALAECGDSSCDSVGL
jgi:hypothetical protein